MLVFNSAPVVIYEVAFTETLESCRRKVDEILNTTEVRAAVIIDLKENPSVTNGMVREVPRIVGGLNGNLPFDVNINTFWANGLPPLEEYAIINGPRKWVFDGVEKLFLGELTITAYAHIKEVNQEGQINIVRYGGVRSIFPFLFISSLIFLISLTHSTTMILKRLENTLGMRFGSKILDSKHSQLRTTLMLS